MLGFLLLLLGVRVRGNGFRRLLRNGVCTGLLSCLGFMPIPSYALMDTTLQDQLKVLQVLQVEDQQKKLKEQEQKSLAAERTKDQVVIVHGTVSLIPPVGVDTTQYPLGFQQARDLDPSFGDNNACLLLTAVGREGPPLAAQKVPKLGSLKFPLVFDLTTDDLIFPYNRAIFEKSKMARDSVGVTAILDSDCVLATPSATSRFGFALSDVKAYDTFQNIDRKNAVLEDGPSSATGLTATPKADGFLRTTADIRVVYKSDGKDYSKEDEEMMARIDRELSSR